MPKSKCFLLIFLIIIISIAILRGALSNNNDNDNDNVSSGLIQEDLPPLDSLLFESGDIILRQGTSFVSSFIARSFPGSHEMSHCGILVEDNGIWKVIHSISGHISEHDGIRIETAKTFMQKAFKNKVILVKPKFNIDRKLITQQAWNYLILKAAFDHEFNLSDSSKLYCSELVRAVYLDAGSEDIFIYKKLAGKKLIDLTSFFDENYWSYQIQTQSR